MKLTHTKKYNSLLILSIGIVTIILVTNFGSVKSRFFGFDEITFWSFTILYSTKSGIIVYVTIILIKCIKSKITKNFLATNDNYSSIIFAFYLTSGHCNEGKKASPSISHYIESVRN